MKRLKKYTFILFQFAMFSANCQVINNTASYRNINSDSYFRFHYDNDFFTATDYFYSQGINVEDVHPSLKKLAFDKFLFHPRGSELKYGLSAEHDAFTPTSIRHVEILHNDRPFAATLLLRLFLISIDSLKEQRISSALSFGCIGPAAGGEWMQKSIHKWLHNIEPLGWENQIQNDFILNYEIDYEKKLFSVSHFFLVNSYAKVCAGSLSDNSSGGATVMIGSFNSPFEKTGGVLVTGKKLRFHFYCQPLFSFIGYDATLQGGLFNRNNPYTISPGEISRVTFQNNFGITVTIRKIYLEYSQSIITKEFREGKYHRWGGVSIGVAL